ncbi:hypothetical protein F5Y05DRAFT_423619 [Hypoxylon sp. FL0543]|nr:hypothetical protein F5Y05DRAFT_423619 [Hypoxylon sp. FL0543]
MAVTGGRNPKHLRRPLARASARIPSRNTAWNPDNIFVGRVATKHLSAAAVNAAGLQIRSGGFRLDPPIYYPPTLPTQSGPRESSLPSYPFYSPPPPTTVNLVRRVPSTQYTPESASESAAVAEEKAEPDVDQESELFGAVPAVKLSDKIHILGFDPEARYIAHALSAIPNLPPVQMLTHHIQSMKSWGEEGRAITIYDKEKNTITSRSIGCPEYIGRQHRQRWIRPPVLHNVIVSTLSSAVLPSLGALRQKIDRRTTLCLLQPGLGMMELLNEKIFDDPATRPNYIICHSSHRYQRHSSLKYSLRHIVSGKLLLHAVPRGEDSDLDRKWSEALGNQHTEHLMKLLCMADGLEAVCLPWHVLLRHKLPEMIFGSLADSISVILGCRYDQIRNSRYTMDFWDSLLSETMRIVVALPELRTNPDMLEHFIKESFPKKLRRRLERYGQEYSQWISLVRKGQMPPAPFFNGYFVRRAQELGLDHSQNSLVLNLVKSRHAGRLMELKMSLPFGLQPYMMDSDKIGGGQDKFDPLLDSEGDF